MIFKKNIEHKLLFRLTLSAFFLAIVVVVLGAFTRLVDAGLGCPDWPGCYGHLLWPNDASEIAKASAIYPDSPVDVAKAWPEMIHRYFAGALGLLIFSIVVVSIRQYRLWSNAARIPVKLPLFLLILVILQAAFGMWTVTLKLWPQVVTMHLLGGFATLSLLWLLGQRLAGQYWFLEARGTAQLNRIKPWLVLALILVVLQIALGGWISSNYAALACPDFPQCLGFWLPPMDVPAGFNFLQDIGPNYLGGQLDNHGRVAIHFFHRVGAVIVLLTLLLLGIALWDVGDAVVRSWVVLLWATLTLQIILGVGNIIWTLPLAVAAAHNAGAAALLLVMVSVCHRVFTAKVAKV